MRVSRSFERILVRVTLMGLVLVVASQLALTGSTTSMLDFTVPGPAVMEEGQMAIGQNLGSRSYITFFLEEFSSMSKAFIYVNGKKRADFSEKYVTIGLYPGDLLEIDTTFYKKPVSIRIEKNDEKVIAIEKDTVLTFRSERKALNAGNID